MADESQPKKLSFDDFQIRQLFGSEDAENEDSARFREYFVRNRAYDNLIAPLPLRILVGHKGVGKSALLRHAFEKDLADGVLAVFLKPDDLSELLRAAGDGDINSRIDAWKNGIKSAIAEKAIEHLTDGAIDRLDEGAVKVGARKVTAILLDALKAIKPQIHDSAQLVIYENFIENQRVNVYIDDIDRGWAARRQDILNISALINALKDISGKDNKLRCRIAIRTDVYYLVRTSDESTDKIEQDVIRLHWSNEEILKLMAFRISTFFKMPYSREGVFALSQNQINREILSNVMEPKFQGRGKWENERTHRVLMSLCRARPRDLVKLLHGAAREAAARKGEKITTQDLIKSFPRYSEERLQDLFNEFRSEMPDIEQFIMQFKPTKLQKTTAENYQYTTDQIITRIKFARGSVTVRFTSRRQVTDKALLTFIYKIDFVIARFARGDHVEWRFFDQSRFLAHEHADFGNAWEVHPAYRWALQPNDVQSVINTISLPQ